ncbi:hypothetical protein CDAR_458191 [Caerostris darwini]|uniref:Uncharacterized protein n=1 Tax=Caerostris darwini TaxID=1538125 RepID=A0AAV4WVM3_9ARAC|nr:hypothetical protein CDAR_458191 [Caerostris darwini]
MRIITEFLIRSQSYSFRNVGFFKGKAISACSTSGRPCNGDRRPTTAVALLLRIVGRLPIEQKVQGGFGLQRWSLPHSSLITRTQNDLQRRTHLFARNGDFELPLKQGSSIVFSPGVREQLSTNGKAAEKPRQADRRLCASQHAQERRMEKITFFSPFYSNSGTSTFYARQRVFRGGYNGFFFPLIAVTHFGLSCILFSQ